MLNLFSLLGTNLSVLMFLVFRNSSAKVRNCKRHPLFSSVPLAKAFRKLSSVYVFSYFPFGFEGRIWDLIVSVPDHCLSFYFAYQSSCGCAVWWP